jgi:AAA domain
MIDQTISLADEDPNAPTAPKAFLAEMELENVRPVLVVLDTWARALWEAGGHDSDQKTVGPSIQACEHIRKVLGGCTLIMVAHVGAAKDAQGRAKGLTDPAGAIDGGTLCKRLGEGALAVYSFKAIHQRHATSDSYTLSALLRSPYDAESHGVGDSVVLMSGDGVVSAAMKQTRLAPATAKLLDVLKAMAAGASVDQWKHAAITAGVLTGTADARKHAFDRGRMALEKAGAVTVEPLTGMVEVAQGPDGEDIDYGTAAEDFEGCEEDAE